MTKQKLEDRLVAKLKKDRYTRQQLVDELGTDMISVESILTRLSENGVDLSAKRQGRHFSYHINVLPDVGNVFDLGGHDGKYHEWTFGYIGDTHIASTFHLPKNMHEALRIASNDFPVKHFFHSGDVIDGRGIYKGHEENLVTSSLEKQTDLAAEAFGRYAGKLRFWAIAGNHDYSFTQQNGAKPLAIIEAKTDNFKNGGDMRADWLINDLRIRTLHGAGGRNYARSYPSQTYLRDYFGGLEREEMQNIPHFLFMGHFHTKYHGKDHGIEVFQPGSFQDGDNEYCIRRGLTGPAGLWVIEVKHTGGEIHQLTSTYVQPKVKGEKGSAFAKTTRNYVK
jgi:predicted phosphodiesterase